MPNITDLCRELRRNQTQAERILWTNLRNRRFNGFKFLRQHPVSIFSIAGKNLYYIPDFYCHAAKLVIEADGPIHLLKRDYDKNRDVVLSQLGLTTIRFTNEQVLNNIDAVLNKIEQHLKNKEVV
jgi:very-short-patch-repair endonuclease